ncbi:MAG: hypothetical protein HYZ71_14035 [Deltaproteobacteria bacterium]|nr:hypothetical protein [Deltaproteobacteria bacterium]
MKLMLACLIAVSGAWGATAVQICKMPSPAPIAKMTKNGVATTACSVSVMTTVVDGGVSSCMWRFLCGTCQTTYTSQMLSACKSPNYLALDAGTGACPPNPLTTMPRCTGPAAYH